LTNLNPNDYSEETLIASTVTRIVSFVSQVLLFVIIWQLSKSVENEGAVVTAEFGEEDAF